MEISKSEFTRLLRLNVFFMTAVPTVSVIVNRIIEYSVFINTGAELNIITINVVDGAGLAIRTRVKIKISSYSEHISRFLGMIENILISAGLIAYRVNIFVTRSAPQPLILGISYLYSTRAPLLFNDDSIQILLRSADGRQKVRLAGWLRSNPRNYNGSEVFYR